MKPRNIWKQQTDDIYRAYVRWHFTVVFWKNFVIFIQSQIVGVYGNNEFSHADLWEFADTTLDGWIPNALAAGKAL